METELKEGEEGEGVGSRERKEGRLLALGTVTVFLGDAGTDRDLFLSIYLSSALLRLDCLCFGTSSSSCSLFLFKDEARGGAISSISTSVFGCVFCSCGCCCCCCFGGCFVFWTSYNGSRGFLSCFPGQRCTSFGCAFFGLSCCCLSCFPELR